MVNDPILIRRREILLSIPVLDYVTAQALFADMPELGTMDESQFGLLVGLALVRQVARKSFFVAMRFDPDPKHIYYRLVDSDKHAKVAIHCRNAQARHPRARVATL